ncbi:MAG: hypothetical protein M3552_12615 [Planctomycetota bacterium]|nr:hypothetical protein [Planctomycetaceae bacterium]MDQ3331476.1 hypothetical protein [Planctomycetota bacterium]
MRLALLIAALAFTAALPGCVIVQTGVTNPIPGMTTVAVAPFVNLSAERVVDGRRFALAYHAELQKIPGYQVIPVGVTEQAMVDLEIDLDSPDDALKLAKALGADAIVIGAVTDYTPYYPPRVGLQVSWYAPEPCRFSPGIPTNPRLNESVKAWRFAATSSDTGDVADDFIVRAQSPDESRTSTQILACEATSEIANGPMLLGPNAPQPPTAGVRTVAAESPQPPADPVPPLPAAELSLPAATMPPAAAQQPAQPLFPPASCPPVSGEHGAVVGPPQWGMEAYGPVAAAANAHGYDPRQPVMSYTRLFDGSDADLTALLRDFVILSGDLRSGGWEAYLHRTEDFIRFTSHRMIVEMLTLHGGESRRRYVWLFRKDRH